MSVCVGGCTCEEYYIMFTFFFRLMSIFEGLTDFVKRGVLILSMGYRAIEITTNTMVMMMMMMTMMMMMIMMIAQGELPDNVGSIIS